jgi:hypothetical protein
VRRDFEFLALEALLYGRAKSLTKRSSSARPGATEMALQCRYADVAQLVEHQLPKLRVAGSIPVVRSEKSPVQSGFFFAPGGRQRFLAAGFDGYLSKPVDVVELTRTMQHFDGRA